MDCLQKCSSVFFISYDIFFVRRSHIAQFLCAIILLGGVKKVSQINPSASVTRLMLLCLPTGDNGLFHNRSITCLLVLVVNDPN